MKYQLSSAGILQLFLIGLVLAVIPGCATIQQVAGFQGQVQRAHDLARIKGIVDRDGGVRGNLVVILAAPLDSDNEAAPPGLDGKPDKLRGVDSYSRPNPGSFKFIVEPGEYRIGAYEDQNRNGLLDPGESFFPTSSSDALVLSSGEEIEADIVLTDALVYRGPPVDLLGIVERDERAQRIFSLGAFSQKGRVVRLESSRFGAEMGKLGLWRPLDFLNEELAGIYFLEEYDPHRVPVLFVHGMSGYPLEFAGLMASLDQTRYQVWFYYYPSGLGLDDISTHLAGLLRELQIRHDYRDIAVVAHSVGGLVSRGAILKYYGDTQRADAKLFISINSPFGGDIKTRKVEAAPIALPPSFADMNPGSAYMKWMLYEDASGSHFKSLPGKLPHHMIMGFGGSGEPCNDGTVSCVSQFQPDIQQHAASVRAWDFTHVGTLDQERTQQRVTQLLDEVFW